MSLMNSIMRPARAPAQSQTNRLLDVISRSSDAMWLATCRDHNRNIRNETVAQAAIARLVELAGPRPAPAAAAPRMSAAEQAHAIWAVLTKRATETASATVAKITYGDLALAIGCAQQGAARTIKPALGLIGTYCVKHNLPALNTLAVDKASMEAADWAVMAEGATPRTERERVVAFDWPAVAPPEPGAFQAPKAPRASGKLVSPQYAVPAAP